MKRLMLCAVAAGLLMPLAAVAGPQKPGKWEMTVEMEGMPMKMPPQTVTQCVTKEQADKPEPPRNAHNSDCKMAEYNINGNVVTWKMVCEKTNTTMDGKMTFTGDSFEGVSHFKMRDQDITTKTTGKRIGDCDK